MYCSYWLYNCKKEIPYKIFGVIVYPYIHLIFQVHIKGSLQWKNDLGLYFSLVLVMKMGMCDLVIFRLV